MVKNIQPHLRWKILTMKKQYVHIDELTIKKKSYYTIENFDNEINETNEVKKRIFNKRGRSFLLHIGKALLFITGAIIAGLIVYDLTSYPDLNFWKYLIFVLVFVISIYVIYSCKEVK